MTDVYTIDAFPALGGFVLASQKCGYNVMFVLDDNDDDLDLFRTNFPSINAKVLKIGHDETDSDLLDKVAQSIDNLRGRSMNPVHIHLHCAPHMQRGMVTRRLDVLAKMIRVWEPNSWSFVLNKSNSKGMKCPFDNHLTIDTFDCGVPQSKRLFVGGSNFAWDTNECPRRVPENVLSFPKEYALCLPIAYKPASYVRPMDVATYTVTERSLKLFDMSTKSVIRSLTPTECLHLQGFLDVPTHRIPVTRSKSLKVISRSVPPQVCECILKGIQFIKK